MEIVRAGGFARYLVKTVPWVAGQFKTFEQKLALALSWLRVVKAGERLLAFEEWHDYIQGGAEVYVAAARVLVASQGQDVGRAFVSKAVINGYARIRRMRERRDVLAAHGLHVPELYSVADACINEQFIPYAIDRQAVSDNRITPEVLDDIIHAAAVLDARGFPTHSFIHDMRTDGAHAYYVDFGWDLWDPGAHPLDNAHKTLLEFVRLYMPGAQPAVEQHYRRELYNQIGGGGDHVHRGSLGAVC